MADNNEAITEKLKTVSLQIWEKAQAYSAKRAEMSKMEKELNELNDQMLTLKSKLSKPKIIGVPK